MAGLTLYSDKHGFIDGDSFEWRNEEPKRTIRPAFKNWEISAMLQKFEMAAVRLRELPALYAQVRELGELVMAIEVFRERAKKAGF